MNDWQQYANHMVRKLNPVESDPYHLADFGPKIQRDTVHALVIDAGSTGSRMHVYEYEPRLLTTPADVSLAASGRKLTYPSTNSLWTERLSPGINTLASIENDTELTAAVTSYLTPLLDYARSILAEKQTMFSHFPIYFRATGGMRALKPPDRIRIMNSVRTVLDDVAFNPFAFTHEFARVISGEEESVFGWTAVNFLMNTLLNNTSGQGTVVNPSLTYGALDMDGASVQISFFDPQQDIMSSLFKLQIGSSRHWNIYAHSYLKFGTFSALERLNARLYHNSDPYSLLVYNPCSPGRYFYNFTSNIFFGSNDIEYQNQTFYTVNMANPNDKGDYYKCADVVLQLLELSSNAFCIFSHNSDCTFAGVYQPKIPAENVNNFAEFLAFGDFHYVWKILQLDTRSNLRKLQEKSIDVCNMSIDELLVYNESSRLNISTTEQLVESCFRAVFAFQMLHIGFGFALDSNITATNVINGQKVSWALGSVLYEINTRPWIYVDSNAKSAETPAQNLNWTAICIAGLLFYVIAIPICLSFRKRRMRRRVSDYPKIGTESEVSNGMESTDNPSTEVVSNNVNSYGSIS
jgi:Golgi nucleoside diphosphatase